MYNLKKKNIFQIFFGIYSFILIFEILLRAVIKNSDTTFNILKISMSLVFFLYIIFIKKVIKKRYRDISILIIIFLLIFLLKIQNIDSLKLTWQWLKTDNNINYIFIIIYFFILNQLKEDINIHSFVNMFRVYNYIIIVISFILFCTNNYLGMVSKANMIIYAWAGTKMHRMMSIFGNPNQAGLYFLMAILILDYERVVAKKKFLCVENFLLVFCSILTFSRTSLISLGIYLIIRNYKLVKKTVKNIKFKFTKIYLSISIFILGIGICIWLVNYYNIYFFSVKYFITTTRFAKWKIGIDYMFKNMLIGTKFNVPIAGYSPQFGFISFSDNMFVEIGAFFGIIIFLLVIIVLSRRIRQAILKKDYFAINKLQILIIPAMLAGTLHFSVYIFLYAVYAICFKLEEIKDEE